MNFIQSLEIYMDLKYHTVGLKAFLIDSAFENAMYGRAFLGFGTVLWVLKPLHALLHGENNT